MCSAGGGTILNGPAPPDTKIPISYLITPIGSTRPIRLCGPPAAPGGAAAKKVLDSGDRSGYNSPNNSISTKPVRKSSTRHSKPSESPGWWDQGGARLWEWTFEGGLNGQPSRCRRGPTRYPPGTRDGA